MRTRRLFEVMVALSAGALFCAALAYGQSSEQMGKLRIQVHPKQAYVFVDGKAIRDGSQTIRLAAGTHAVGVYNYGYLEKTQNVHVGAGEVTRLNVSLQASGDKVSGPFADLEFKGDPRAAVFLNGASPSYFVGHVDEFDWDWIWHQRLLVHPGTYQVTVKNQGNTIWSGNVTAKAGQKVIVRLNDNGKTTVKDWKKGERLGPQPRFAVGIASATVPVAPVTAKLVAATGSIHCGQNTTLKWNSANAAETSISGVGSVSQQGDRAVSPTGKMTYTLTAIGPGGKASSSATVAVNTQPAVTLAVSQPVLRYHKIGDRIVQQDSATLNWSSTNADRASITPFGNEGMSGSRVILAAPTQTAAGPLSEDQTYTMTAKNACGGVTTKTATLHLTGSIDPPPSATLASIFYPTAYPTRMHPHTGLVASEKTTLNDLAGQFKNFSEYERQAGLLVVGHADVRGTRKYNQKLSERRAELIKAYLVSKGVPAQEVQAQGQGKDHQLSAKAVRSLQLKDREKPPKWMKNHKKATWLAYNRRVDIILQPVGQASTRLYPNDIAHAHLVWQRHEPSFKTVSGAGRTPRGIEQASLVKSGS